MTNVSDCGVNSSFGRETDMKIKICGLKREEDIIYANELRPDYVGFVFALKKREITYEQAERLRAMLDPGIPAVGVYVDKRPERIIEALERGIIDIAQLHGNETQEDIGLIKARTGKPVWKAVKIRSGEDVRRWEDSQADMLVFDNGQGTGKCFPWELLAEAKREFLLAGGITTENIAEAIRSVHPFGIDVSSGAETDGLKDYKKMKMLVEAVRAFDREKMKLEEKDK